MTDERAIWEPLVRDVGANAGLQPIDYWVRQIGQESDWQSDVIRCQRDSSAGAQGIAQLVPRFHPTVDPCNPYTALPYAAGLMRSHLDYFKGSWPLALSAYNAGRQATIDGLAGKKAGWPFAETVRYVSAIMLIPEILASGYLIGKGVATVKLSEVLARGQSRVGDPYVWGGKTPPTTDCSGFVSWCYNGQVPSYTDAILGATQRVETPLPGDIVLYQYTDPEQPGVQFPHVALYLDDATVLDNRFGYGVGVHPQLSRGAHTRYYRGFMGVVADTAAPVTTSDGQLTAIAYLSDVVVPMMATDPARALSEAKRVREQYVGVKPV